ncbi:MAG: isopentenyl-diphosphate delta-isomerase [Candidatus Andersenbacteria bacterium RIFCSPHIGHO2_12_FULL_45_11b]|uniref:Isopentenyl-diphosphate delta-isomerase n=1 Tax=Candidatus Andersenbacteria bacterium RIFCSPHIGHO2_12_FULL_45_11b TaxID=1797282 RepID=A0A1G1X603_9BACT|nr:MAG: isopentenyl-diphosphate delta-isomerase [Candidatus Andersenbacteria bacterium RIFCSPHIGHO2_12_FULL_45_11b]
MNEDLRNLVILVDEHDNELGLHEKLDAHIQGLLHRAFSVLIYNDKGEMMLQQRALMKYHSGGLWTNACCGHPMKDELTDKAPHRRLQEEMGFNCELTKQTEFIYNVPVPPNLIEHEYLHVYHGIYNDEPVLNPEEAMGYRWISKKDLEKEVKNNPEHFTPWFLLLLIKVKPSFPDLIGESTSL